MDERPPDGVGGPAPSTIPVSLVLTRRREPPDIAPYFHHPSARHRSPQLTIVRTATIEDSAALARIANEIHAMHAAGRPSAFRSDRAEVFTAERMGALVGAERQFVWVAEEGEAITGFAHASLHDEPEMPWRFATRVLELIAMAVTSARRGGGVGTQLLDMVFRAAREHQASEVRLKVWGFNDGARRFYRRHGFTLLTEQLGRTVEQADR